MTYVPRTTFYGVSTSWANAASRPTNPNHGQVGLNEATGNLEVYDSVAAAWRVYIPTGASGSGAFSALTATSLNAGSATISNLYATAIAATATYNAGGNSSCTTAASAYTSATAVAQPVNLISISAATNNFFRLPAAYLGLSCNVINIGASTVGLIGNSNGVSLAGAASTALATADATGCALELVCDGTNWHKRAQ